MILAVTTLPVSTFVCGNDDDGIVYTEANDSYCDMYITHTSNFIYHFATYCWHDYIDEI